MGPNIQLVDNPDLVAVYATFPRRTYEATVDAKSRLALPSELRRLWPRRLNDRLVADIKVEIDRFGILYDGKRVYAVAKPVPRDVFQETLERYGAREEDTPPDYRKLALVRGRIHPFDVMATNIRLYTKQERVRDRDVVYLDLRTTLEERMYEERAGETVELVAAQLRGSIDDIKTDGQGRFSIPADFRKVIAAQESRAVTLITRERGVVVMATADAQYIAEHATIPEGTLLQLRH